MSEVMGIEYQRLVANTICHATEMTQEAMRMVLSQYERPSVLFRPKIFVDGNQWCALYGEDLQSGVAGFGDSPDIAMRDFDTSWYTVLKANKVV